MAFKPNYGRDRAERARAARARSEEKKRKRDEKTALRKAQRAEAEALICIKGELTPMMLICGPQQKPRPGAEHERTNECLEGGERAWVGTWRMAFVLVDTGRT
jgi:hypothetical protein